MGKVAKFPTKPAPPTACAKSIGQQLIDLGREIMAGKKGAVVEYAVVLGRSLTGTKFDQVYIHAAHYDCSDPVMEKIDLWQTSQLLSRGVFQLGQSAEMNGWITRTAEEFELDEEED